MKFNRSTLWLISLALSVIAIGVITIKWSNIHSKQIKGAVKEDSIVVVKDTTRLNSYLNRENINDPFYKVKTGFFIQSLAFISSHEINFTGYIWQKYPPEFPATWEKGVIFPEAVNTSETQLNKLYSSEEIQNGMKYQLIGWYFDVNVRQIFDYTKYPLDNVTAWLRVWAKDLNNDDKIILIPDFDSYMENDLIFGIDPDIVFGEWEIDSTFYSYHQVTYDTNFGYSGVGKIEKDSELYFNVGMKRNFTDAIILNLIPLFVVALLLFAQIMTVTNQEHLIAKFGFNTSVAIGTCSALFFIVLLAHIQVRRQFLDSPLVYIEYFYLVMYVIILLIALNAYIFSLGKQKSSLNLIYYHDNLIPKVTFWPLLLWTLVIVTIAKL